MRQVAVAGCLLVALVVSCNRPDRAEPTNEPAPFDAGAARFACASAAGLCKCVQVPFTSSAPTTCSTSSCCFVDARGDCICVAPTAAPSCAQAKEALRSTADVAHCPPATASE